MVRPARLTLALLVAGVVFAHLLGLEWISREAGAISGLKAMVPPMYTRLLKPATPPPVTPVAAAPPAKPKPRIAPRPKPPASSPEEIRRKREQEAELAQRKAEEEQAKLAREQAQREQARREQDERERQEREAQAQRAKEEEAQAAAAAASQAQAAASAASAAKAEAIARWPVDTRLNYRLGGQFRGGPLFGDARVQWQREGDKYQVRLDVKIQVFGTQVLTSQGEVTPEGLIPRAYEELGPRRRRSAQIGDEVVILENGRTLPRPPGVQDTASQFVELSQRFATGRDVLAVGRTVTLWLARPGGVDQWIYDIVESEKLRTPMGPVEAFHLKPRPIPNGRGDITAEMWFAPSLQYLPVRIKVLKGADDYLDLVVDHIEQR